jgi:hypothetical protein
MTIDEIADAYERSTAEFDQLASSVPAESLDAHQPGEWSARQIIHHVADSEAQSYARLRSLVAEPAGSVIQGYDEGAWAECSALGYEQLPVENSLAVYRAVRAGSLDVLRRLTPTDLDRRGVHTESGEYSVRTWITNYTAHPIDHADQLRRALEAASA